MRKANGYTIQDSKINKQSINNRKVATDIKKIFVSVKICHQSNEKCTRTLVVENKYRQ